MQSSPHDDNSTKINILNIRTKYKYTKYKYTIVVCAAVCYLCKLTKWMLLMLLMRVFDAAHRGQAHVIYLS